MVFIWFFLIAILIQPLLSSEDGIRSKKQTNLVNKKFLTFNESVNNLISINTSISTIDIVAKNDTSALRIIAMPKNDTFELQTISKRKNDTIELQMTSKPKNDTFELQTTLKPKNDTFELQTASKPKNNTFEVQTTSKPKNDTFELQTASKPKNNTFEVQTTSKPKNDTFELQTTSKPKNDTVELQTTSKPKNDTFELQTTSKPKNDAFELQTTSKPKNDTFELQTTSKPKNDTVELQTTSKPKNDTVELQTTSKPKNDTVELQTTSKPKNDTVELQTTSKPKNNSKSNNESSGNSNLGIMFTSIRDICFAFGVPPINCTCEKMPQFCELFGGKEEAPKELVRYTYNRSDTYLYAALSSTAAIIGVFVNFGVLLVSFVHRKSLARSNHLVALLSLFDFTTCVFQFFGSIYLFKTIRWPYGLAMCKVFRGMELLGSFVAVEIMLLICVERFVGIIYPFQNVVSMDHLMKALICIAILIAIGSLVPLLMVVVIDEPSGRCIDTWRGTSSAVIYEWFILAFFFTLPVIIIFIGYGIIMRYLHKQSKSHVITTQEMIKQRLKRNRRVMYLLISIVGGFIILTLPNRAIHLYLELVSLKDPKTYKILVFIAYVTYPLHSVVNPFIYSLVDKDFRNKLQNLTIRKITSIKMPLISVTSKGRESTTESSL